MRGEGKRRHHLPRPPLPHGACGEGRRRGLALPRPARLERALERAAGARTGGGRSSRAGVRPVPADIPATLFLGGLSCQGALLRPSSEDSVLGVRGRAGIPSDKGVSGSFAAAPSLRGVSGWHWSSQGSFHLKPLLRLHTDS